MSVLSPKTCFVALCAVLFALAGCDVLPQFSMEKGCSATQPCTAGYVCVDGFCLSEAYLPDGDTDAADSADTADDDNDDTTDTGDADDNMPVCEPGETRCMGDTVQWCENGAWEAVIDCAEASLQCRDGQCTHIPLDGDDTDSDVDADIVDGECFPGERSCSGDQVVECNGAGSWIPVANCERGSLVCSEGECVCPEPGRMCYDDTTVLACRNGAWTLASDCAALGLVCVEGECRNPGGDVLCPEGLFCQPAGIWQLAYGCLNADGSVPEDNRDWCDPGGSEPQCQSNKICTCMDESCNDARCVDACGECPQGQYCETILETGLKGCLQNQNVPEDAVWGCGMDEPCPFNSACYCLDANCDATVCIAYCSEPTP